jgi:hypothetical protein
MVGIAHLVMAPGVTPIRRANSTRDMPLRDNHSASFMGKA